MASTTSRPPATPEALTAALLDAAVSGAAAEAERLLRDGHISATVKQRMPLRICPKIACIAPSLWHAQCSATALHLAAAHGHLDCVRVLLLRGADPRALTRSLCGATPSMLAAFGGHAAVLACLEAASDRPHPATRLSPLLLAAAAAGGNGATAEEAAEAAAACVGVLLGAGAASRVAPDGASAGGLTPLHVAAALHRASACARLVEVGSSVQRRDAAGRTPLDYARRAQPAAGEEAQRATLRALLWLPQVRLLWLGQRSTPGVGLGKLDRDAMLLVCSAVVGAAERGGAPATPEGTGVAEEFWRRTATYFTWHLHNLGVRC